MLYDQLTAGRGVQSTCYCIYCQEEFRRTYDREMPRFPHQGSYYDQPVVEDPEAQRVLRDFQIRNARHFCRRIQRAFDDVRPEAFYIQNWLFGGMAEECGEFVDGLFGERHITTDVNEVALAHRLMRAYGHKPVWGNYSYSYHHHATFRSVESTHMALMDTVASGCSATLLDLNATDDNKNRYDDMKEAMRQVRWTTDALKDSHHVKYAAVLHSRASEEFAHDDFVPSFEGTFEILAEQQVPLEFITEKSVQSGGLDGYKVLVMPNTAYVSDATAEAITAFVQTVGGWWRLIGRACSTIGGKCERTTGSPRWRGSAGARSWRGIWILGIRRWTHRSTFRAWTWLPGAAISGISVRTITPLSRKELRKGSCIFGRPLSVSTPLIKPPSPPQSLTPIRSS